jgi:hypothetical protein
MLACGLRPTWLLPSRSLSRSVPGGRSEPRCNRETKPFMETIYELVDRVRRRPPARLIRKSLPWIIPGNRNKRRTARTARRNRQVLSKRIDFYGGGDCWVGAWKGTLRRRPDSFLQLADNLVTFLTDTTVIVSPPRVICVAIRRLWPVSHLCCCTGLVVAHLDRQSNQGEEEP